MDCEVDAQGIPPGGEGGEGNGHGGPRGILSSASLGGFPPASS